MLARRSRRLSAEPLAESDAVLVEKLHRTEGKYLKRAATLLFHADPEKFTTGACVKIGFFRTDSDLLYHNVIKFWLSRASCVMRAQSPCASASAGTSHEPPMQTTLDNAKKSPAFCIVMPPVGQNLMS